MFKTYAADYKAGPDDGLAEGQFRALVSVFGVKDSMGDVVAPGAFTDTLAEWAEKGDPIPVYWSHQMSDPDFNIGWVDPSDARETEKGLEVVGQFDLDPDGSPKARQAYRLLKGRRSTQFSFAYEVLDGGPVEKDGESFNELRKLRLYEVSPTPIGANPATELLGVKFAPEAALHQLKAGRVLSAKNEATLRDALDAISAGVTQVKNVLASVTSGTSDPDDDGGKAASPATEKANEPGPATDKEPPVKGATDKEPSRRTPVSTLAAHLSLLELGAPDESA